MKIFPLIIIFSFGLLTTQLTNNQAQNCFSQSVNSNKCSLELSKCYSNPKCQQQVASFPCNFMNDDNLFNGFCFRHWQGNSVFSKQLIDCLVSQCDLTYNSKYNMTKFYQCNSNVVHSLQKLQCGQQCYSALQQVMNCMKTSPVQQCYSGQKQDKQSNRIVKAIRQVCLQGKQLQDQIEGEENTKQEQL